MDSDTGLEALVSKLLGALGEDTTRYGLAETPRRVAAAYREMLAGYDRSLEVEARFFPNTKKYDGIIIATGIEFFSLCEHHLLPFWGHATVAYVPTDRIIGLSKLARAVDIYSRRLQEQERLTAEIADAIGDVLVPRGVAVHIQAAHMCNMMRGVEKKHSGLVTTIFRGVFLENRELREQFLQAACWVPNPSPAP